MQATFTDMQGAFCPGNLCTLPPDMIKNSWGTPNMAPVYMMYGVAGVVGAPAILADVGITAVARNLV